MCSDNGASRIAVGLSLPDPVGAAINSTVSSSTPTSSSQKYKADATGLDPVEEADMSAARLPIFIGGQGEYPDP